MEQRRISKNPMAAKTPEQMSEGGAISARSESSTSPSTGTAAQQQQPRKPLKSRPSVATEKKGVEGASATSDGAASKGSASRAIAPPTAEPEVVKPPPRLVSASATRKARPSQRIETADGNNGGSGAGEGEAAAASATRAVHEPVAAVQERRVQVALEWVYGCQYARLNTRIVD